MERLLAGDELLLHREDAASLGLSDIAVINYDGIPGAFRISLSNDERDRGLARLSYQSRMLLGIGQRTFSFLPEISVVPALRSPRGSPLLVSEPQWDTKDKLRIRWLRKVDGWFEAVARSLLSAPEIAFRTVDALPGEDHACTVRLTADLFPLLGTQPGKQVYVAWGNRNTVVATALVADDPKLSPAQWASTDRVGYHSPRARAIPAFARLRVGAEIRASLGIPRTAVVTVRRRVTSLILSKLNELIIPATGLFIALNVDAKLKTWEVLLAIGVILALLLVPLRIRPNPRGRVH
jgi:hypothetical protein